ncbi:MAG TPA: NADPH-dependent FMN reductase [Polyangia bacterium]|nr:NADPH-dependent FMN reductase [Polyangia bacterium]
MSRIVTITGSPSETSRTARLARDVGAWLTAREFDVSAVNVRDLPAAELLQARADAPPIAEAVAAVEGAQGVVLCSPVYKAAYSGILKTFLDLLPQTALAGKVVLPLMTGGTVAHVLALDYAFRPVLTALGAQHVVTGLFILDKTIGVRDDGGIDLAADIRARLDAVLADFGASVVRLAQAR